MRRAMLHAGCGVGGACVCVQRFISKEWHPHSEQLKSWIAASSDPKSSSAGRAYIYNLKACETVKTFDDVLDLSLSMKKLQYVLGGKTTEEIQEVLSHVGPQVEQIDLDKLCKLVSVHPDAALDVFTSILCNSAVLTKVDQILSRASPEKVIALAATVWRLTASQDADGLSPFFLCVGHRLSVHLKGATHPQMVMIEIINGNPPLCSPSLDELRKTFVELIRKLSCRDALTIMESVAVHQPTNEPSVVNALQRSFTKTVSVPSEQETARFMRALSTTDFKLSADMAALAHVTIAQCSETILLSISTCLRRQLVMHPEHVDLLKTRDAIVRRVIVDVRKTNTTTQSCLYLIACLSEIDPTHTRRIFENFVGRSERTLEEVDVPQLLIIMKNTGMCPPEALRAVQMVKAESQGEPMSVYTLYAQALSGFSKDERLFQHCLTNRGLQKYGRRFKSQGTLHTLKDEESTAFLLLALLHWGSSDADTAAQLLLRQWAPTRFGVHVLLTHLRRLGTVNAAIAQSITTAAVRHVALLTGDEVVVILELMSAANVRNAAVLELLLERLASLSPPFSSVLCAVRCAQRLRLGSAFERSGLINSIQSLDDVSDRDLVRFLRACPRAQRDKIVQLRGADSLVEELPLSKLETPELMTLFSVVQHKTLRRRILGELHSRNATTEADVTSEDALAAVEAANQSEQIRELFRVGGQSLQHVDEGQLARLQLKLKSLNTCPNVCFRVIGKALLRLADRLPAESALLWLSLYMTHNVKDDSVGKALIRKVNSRASSLSRSATKELGEASRFFGLETAQAPPKRSKRKKPTVLTGGEQTW